MTTAATPEALEQALAEFQRRNGYHRPEIEELLMEFGELVLATASTEAASLRAERDEAVNKANEEETSAAWDKAMRQVAENEAARLRAKVEALKAERDEARSHLPEGLRDASLTGAIRSLALAASSENENKWRWGRALQIGLAFADKAAGEEWEHDGMASVDACYAMAAILECECGGSVWNEMVKAGAARFAEHTALARAATAEEPKPWPRIPQPFSERGFDSLWIAEWRAKNSGSLGEAKKAHNKALRAARAATAGEGRSDG